METLQATPDGRVLVTENTYRECAVGTITVTTMVAVYPDRTLVSRDIIVYKTEESVTGYGQEIFRGTMADLIKRLDNATE